MGAERVRTDVRTDAPPADRGRKESCVRHIHLLGLAALVTAAMVLPASAATPAHGSAKPPSRTAAHPRSDIRRDVPDATGEDDGIERMDGPDAWDRLGMGPAGLAVPYGRDRGRSAAGLRMRAAAERRLALAKQLELSTEQRDRIAGIRERQGRFMIGLQAKLKLARLDLRALLRADRLERPALEAKVDEISRLESQARKARLEAMLDVRGVLTAEQLRRLKTLRDQAGENGGN